MNYTLVLEGIMLGLGLAVLAGPLFFILLEASINKGQETALQVAGGIWISDVLIASMSLLFIDRVKAFVDMEGFETYVGSLGGVILVFLGLGTYFSNAKKNKKTSGKSYAVGRVGTLKNALTGFIVNTANPFTFFFWISVTTSYFIGKGVSTPEAVLLLGTIITVIVLSDIGKIYFAKYISRYINADKLRIGEILGAVLCIFGIILILRTYAF